MQSQHERDSLLDQASSSYGTETILIEPTPVLPSVILEKIMRPIELIISTEATFQKKTFQRLRYDTYGYRIGKPETVERDRENCGCLTRASLFFKSAAVVEESYQKTRAASYVK